MANDLNDDSGLPSWPEDWQSTEETLRPDRIAEHGMALLYRGLNTKRLIAFVGSGVSAAYGRVGWAELALFHARRLKELLSHLREPDPRAAFLSQLRSITQSGRNLPGDRIMTALMLCEQIWHLTPPEADLGILADGFGLRARLERLEAGGRVKPTEWGKELFRTWIKRETHDEQGHVLRVLSGTEQAGADPATPAQEAPRDPIQTLMEDFKKRPLHRSNIEDTSRPHLHWFQGNEKDHAAKRWVNALEHPKMLQYLEACRLRDCSSRRDHIDRCLNSVRLVLDSLTPLSAAGPISPVRYYAFGYVLDVLRLIDSAAARIFLSCLRESSPTLRQLCRPREASIPRNADPLYELAYGLNVRRYATTNYDLEIERFLHDMGFGPPSILAGAELSAVDAAVRVDQMGARARDFVLSERTVAEMLDFATDDNTYAFELVHLHGRSTDEESIVVTERDYQETYVRAGVFHHAFNEAREAAFGGNPIFFVGFGMTEADVLRPLREFAIAEQRRNRAVIALLPADRTQEERDTFAIDQFVKYGVSVTYYGEGRGCRHERGWMAELFSATDDLGKALGQHGKGKPSAATFAQIAGRFECLPGDDPCGIAFEVSFLQKLATLSATLAHSTEPAAEPFLRSVPEYLERTKVAVKTAALCDRLRAIRHGWEQWWRTWQQAPLDRGDTVRYTCREGDERKLRGPLWSRHRVRDDYDLEPPPLWALDSFDAGNPPGRRSIAITAPKGTGKGLLYSYLTQTWELSESAKVVYLGQFFATFGFTCEVASVWDALSFFFLSPTEFPILGNPREPERKVQDIWARIKQDYGISNNDFRALSRCERLDRSLRIARRCIDAARQQLRYHAKHPRILVAFNRFDLLLDANGRAKQGEIHDVLEVLFSDEHAQLPLDLLFLVRETHLPWQFRELHETGKHRSDGVTKSVVPRIVLPDVSQTPQTPPQLEAILAVLLRCGAVLKPSPSAGTLSIEWLKQAARAPGKQVSKENYIYVLPPSSPQSFQPVNEWRRARELLEDRLQARAAGTAPDANETATLLETFCSRHLASSRYAYTLLMKITKNLTENADPADRIKRLDTLLGAIELMPHSTGSGISNRYYEIVLQYWFGRGSRSLSPADDPLLHDLLVRHISVIAMPVRASVLARCPLVAARLDKLESSAPNPPGRQTGPNPEGPSREALINQALETLAARSLVLRLDGVTVSAPHETIPNCRYQVHRSIQMFVYECLGSHSSERAEAHIFGPSLYAAQARHFPQLSSTSYAFLRQLVFCLSFYPDRLGEALSSFKTQTELKDLADCVRAALGVIRTLYSLGTVTRFADSDGLPPRSPRQMGYLEHHRLLIRWMIKVAAWIDHRENHRVRPPFYRDETVWLFNECGVFSYAQGRCDDARALFERALELQREIEGPAGGPMRRRILLNAGLNAIDRGRLRVARRAFEEVLSARQDDPLHQPLARGFLGLVEHYSGEVGVARQHYDEAIDQLVQLGRVRPVALLRQHSGNLYLHGEDFEAAKREFRDALQIAAAGSYADLVHYARLGEAKACMREPKWPRTSEQALRSLKDAQEYAARMDIPRLSIEVLLLHGEILINQGEALLAGEMITRALQMANLNGLMFRRISALELLSKVYEVRDDAASAQRLRAQAERAARSMGYNLAVFRIVRGGL